MSQAEELLNSLPDVEATADEGYDDIDYFVVNHNSRTITKPSNFICFGVESDEDSVMVYFKSLNQVTKITKLSDLNLYINFKNANGVKDKYIVEDVSIVGDYIYFSWKLSRLVLAYKGNISFIICGVRTKDDGTKEVEWNTTPCIGPVLEGLEVDNPVDIEPASDLVDQLVNIINNNIREAEEQRRAVAEDIEMRKQDALSAIEEQEADGVDAVNAAKEAAVDYIGNGLDKTLAKQGIAAESQAVGNAILKARIVDRASGELISLPDSAEAPLQSMKIFGKTTQDGTPTPENPIKLASVGDNENLSVVCGNNILPYPYVTPSSVRYTENVDGSITVNIKHEDGLVYFTLYDGSPLSSEVAKIALLGQHHNMVIYCKILDNEDNELYFENSPSALTIDFREYPSDAKVKIGIRNNVKPYNASGTVYPVYMSDFSECSVAIPPLRSIIGTNVRDEIDAARKVRVQRVGREILTKAERTFISYGDVCCDCTVANFPLYGEVCSDRYSQDTDSVIPSNNQISGSLYSIYIGDSRFTDIDKANEILAKEKPEVLYELAEPIETPLSDEELQAYKALYTYYPKTFIYNSENTDIEIGYVADTKLYIDRKIQEAVANG